jgi:site-specific DNA-adenine methylase
MNYGLPYKGSKNKLAERIVRLLPQRKNLYDLFCGGCAVSHAALLMGKYEHIHINDFNWMCPTLFMDALAGKYDNETRWISREDFQRLKTTDPYAAVVWSFGSNMRDYMYSREIEPLKRAIHYAIFFSDYKPGLELGHDLSFVDGISDVQQRYSLIRRYFSKDMHSPAQSFEGGKTQRMQNVEALQRLNTQLQNGGGRNSTHGADCPDADNSKKSQYSWKAGTDWTGSTRLQHRERLCAVEQIRGGGQDLPITSSVMDYAEVKIPEDSVIYCDIPYIGTNVYNGAEQFDYERFYDWACRQTEPVFISSYEMPEDRFERVMEFQRHSTLCATANNLVTERIFIPRDQTERGNLPPRQLSLFDDM